MVWIINIFKQIFGDIGLTLNLLSLIATVVVSFMIYWLQLRHEKEIERLQENQRKKDVENQAHAFLVDHEEERDYLPWCVLASELHRHEKHSRKIYTDFCRIPDELQNQVLNMAGFNIRILPKSQWLMQAFDLLQEDIEQHQLGRDVLYDGAKYFHRGFYRYREKRWEDVDSQAIFKPIYKGPWFNPKGELNCGAYISEYIWFTKREKKIDDILTMELNPVPPIDYVWEGNELGKAEESIVCAWVMTLVHDIAASLPENTIDEKCTDADLIDYTDAMVESYEDKYYAALQILYNKYVVKLKPTKKGRNNER